MISEALLLADHLFSALLTGLYQGLLLTAVVWLCLRLSWRANAATRYAVWFLTLCVVAALPVAHLALGSDAKKAALAKKDHQSGEPEPFSAKPHHETPSTVEEGWLHLETSELVVEIRQTEPALETTALSPLPQKSQLASESLSPSVQDPKPSRNPLPFSAAQALGLKRIDPVSLPLTPLASSIVICAIMALGAGRSLALLLQLFDLRGIRRASVPAPDWLRERFERIVSAVGLKRRLDLRVSEDVHSPIVLGLLPPAVIVPDSFLATPTPARLDPVFRHELAHILRFDHWLNLGQQIIKALFGFHPAVLWISKKISTEREIACDDQVLEAGQRPRAYALLLTEFASRDRSRAWTAAPAAWSRRSQLSERVNMILRTDRSTSPRLGRTHLGLVTAGISACLMVLFAFAPRMTLGREPAGLARTSENAISAAPSAHVVNASATAGLAAVNVAVPATLSAPVLVGDAPAYTAAVIAANAPRWIMPNQGTPATAPVLLVQHQNSIDERLERVERMLEKLLSEKPGPMHGMYAPAQPRVGTPGPIRPGTGPTVVAPRPAPAPYHLPGQPQPDVFRPEAKPRSEADRERARSLARQGQARVAEREWSLKKGTAELMQERQTLEARRRALEAQIAALQAQLERLESEQEKFEQERERLEEQRREQEQNHDQHHQQHKEQDDCDQDLQKDKQSEDQKGERQTK